jgi:hypothetical protein
MSPASICSYKALRATSSKRVVATMGRLMMVHAAVIEAIRQRPNVTGVAI